DLDEPYGRLFYSGQENMSKSPRRRREPAQTEVRVLDDLEALPVLGHPLRVQILEALPPPASAAAVARSVHQPRQKVNYHLKELERVGLVRATGERRVGNFVETLFQAVARAYVVSPRIAWADPRRVEALTEQHSLATLHLLGERLQRDAAALLDRAAFEGEQIASASVVAEVRFASEADREAFVDGYLRATAELLDRYGKKQGSAYRVVLAAYPETEGEERGARSTSAASWWRCPGREPGRRSRTRASARRGWGAARSNASSPSRSRSGSSTRTSSRGRRPSPGSPGATRPA